MERAETEPVRQVSDDDLVRIILGVESGASAPVAALSSASAAEISQTLGVPQAGPHAWPVPSSEIKHNSNNCKIVSTEALQTRQ